MEKKPENKTMYLPIFMCMGSSIGMAIGVAMGNIGIGMCMGVAIGVGVGSAIDNMNRNKEAGSQDQEEK